MCLRVELLKYFLVLMYMLPDDIIEYIMCHKYALILQFHIRKYLRKIYTSHRLTVYWNTLNKYKNIQELEKYELVRKELRSEPESWVYELKKNGNNLTTLILEECREGLWGKKSEIICRL